MATATQTIRKEEIVAQWKKGNRLNVYTTLSGRSAHTYLPEPELKPTFLIVETYQLSHFLGQYGAGRTVKTFSLLPGEKTTISIKSFRNTTSTSLKASSILDSYTETKADEFESSIRAEETNKENTSKNFEYHAETEASAGWGWGSASVSGGVSGGSTAAREQFASNTSSAAEKQAASSSAQRDVEVNSNYEVTNSSGEETSIVREIENINVGRALNFTFRQLNQEFISLLHLTDIRVAFFNGFAESRDEVPLSQVDRLLATYIKSEAQQAEVKKALFKQINFLRDYEGNIQKVVDDEAETACPENPEKYWRFNSNHYTEYKDKATDATFKVKGYIVDAKKITMRTESVMVEALLGQAESLDDYSRGLQNERVKAQEMTNKRIDLDIKLEEMRQDIIATKDQEKAALYKMMYHEPQTTEEENAE